MSNAIDQIVIQIYALFQARPMWIILVLALILTIILRFALVRLFKFVLNLFLFALIYFAVLLGLSYLIT